MNNASHGAQSDRAKQKNPTNELINQTPRKRGQRTWTAEQRAAAAVRARRHRPWIHSTGPRTQSGKSCAKMNAYRHGLRGRAHRRLIDAIHEQARFSNAVNHWVRACNIARRSGFIEPPFTFERKVFERKEDPIAFRDGACYQGLLFSLNKTKTRS